MSASLAAAVPVGAKLDALTRAAALVFPAACRAAIAAADTRDASDVGGVPVRAVPFTSAPVLAAASRAVVDSAAAAAAARAPPDARLTASAVAAIGSAE
jgi:hypothetical protein